MSFQKEYEDYLVHSGVITEEELAHYGVPGMKWGVRKSVYKSLNRRQRRALKSYGTMREGANRLKKRGNYSGHREANKYKAKLERAMGIKINDESAAGSSKNGSLIRGLVGGVPADLAVRASRASTYKKLSNQSNSEMREYLGKKKKK